MWQTQTIGMYSINGGINISSGLYSRTLLHILKTTDKLVNLLLFQRVVYYPVKNTSQPLWILTFGKLKILLKPHHVKWSSFPGFQILKVRNKNAFICTTEQNNNKNIILLSLNST